MYHAKNISIKTVENKTERKIMKKVIRKPRQHSWRELENGEEQQEQPELFN